MQEYAARFGDAEAIHRNVAWFESSDDADDWVADPKRPAGAIYTIREAVGAFCPAYLRNWPESDDAD